MKKFSLILLALAILSGLVAFTFQPAAAAGDGDGDGDRATTCAVWHTVVRGEYLSKIARIYETDWRTLAEINNLKNPSLIFPGQKLCVALSGSTGDGAPVVIPDTGASTSARIYASSVEEDTFVTLRGRSLDENTRYTIYLNRYGAAFSRAQLVGSVFTDKNGAFTRTFNIPSKLADVSKISVSAFSRSGDSASNWFINATAEGNTGGVGSPTFSFSIVSVKEGESVRIKTSNLPANVTFEVFMGKVGTKGLKGIFVGTLRDEDGGSVKATFDIPEELQGRSKIDIRLVNNGLNISAYQTFEND